MARHDLADVALCDAHLLGKGGWLDLALAHEALDVLPEDAVEGS